jgi:hypothetical protein
MAGGLPGQAVEIWSPLPLGVGVSTVIPNLVEAKRLKIGEELANDLLAGADEAINLLSLVL